MKKQDGYIALLVVVLISSLLLITTTEIGASAALHRFNIENTEEAVQASYLSESCLYTALLKLAQNQNYLGSEEVDMGSSGKCKLQAIVQNGGNIEIKTSATMNGQNSQLTALVEKKTLSIVLFY